MKTSAADTSRAVVKRQATAVDVAKVAAKRVLARVPTKEGAGIVSGVLAGVAWCSLFPTSNPMDELFRWVMAPLIAVMAGSLVRVVVDLGQPAVWWLGEFWESCREEAERD